ARLWANRDRGGQLKLQAGFRRELEMLRALAGHDRPACGACGRTDGRARSAAGDAADDGAEAGAAGDLAPRLLAFTRSLRLDIGRDDVVADAAEGERVRLQG